MVKVDFLSLIGYPARAADFIRKQLIKLLNKLHQAVVIGKCLIKLNGCKFGIVLGVHSLVSEYTPDLIHTVHTAYN